MTFIKIIILVILCILTIKLLRIVATIIKNGHTTMAIFVSPIKRLIIWEWNNFKILFMNLYSTKADIFKSLTNRHEVGVVRDNLDSMGSNKILIGLFHLTWQLAILILLSTHSFDDVLRIILGLKLNLIVALISLVIVVIYVIFKIVKIKSYEDDAIKSTMPLPLNIHFTINGDKL
ncbi:MAG: hypothetical protein K2P99_06120 [Burkholderiales bacterium]|nr:hypothetical protein [Burkholderiales bacterium]